MPDHRGYIRIMLPVVFRAEICQRLLKRATLGQNSVNEIAHLGWRFFGAIGCGYWRRRP